MSKVFMLGTAEVADLERRSRNEVVDWLYEAVKLNPGIPSETLVMAVNEWLGNDERLIDSDNTVYAGSDVAGMGDLEFAPLDEDPEGDVVNPADEANDAATSYEDEVFHEDVALEVLETEADWDDSVSDLEDTVEFSPAELAEIEEPTYAEEPAEEEAAAPVTEEEVTPVEEDNQILVAMDEDYVVEVAPNDAELALAEAANEIAQESISLAAQARIDMRSILRDAAALDRSSK